MEFYTQILHTLVWRVVVILLEDNYHLDELLVHVDLKI